MDFDLEELVNVEQAFFEDGFRDGYVHGRVHGSIEGRALGREKGFEMWEELGFYEGFALLWQAVSEKRGAGEDQRAAHHTRHLLDLIAQFPRANPSSSEASEMDVPRLFRQIRSRYKALCAVLGVRPTLRAGGPDPKSGGGDQGEDARREGKERESVWAVEGGDRPLAGTELDF